MSVKGLWMFLWLPNRLPENGIPSWRRRVQQLILRTPSSAPWTNGAYLPIWTYQKIKSRPRLPGWAANRGRRISSFLNDGEFESCAFPKASKSEEFASPAHYFTNPNFWNVPKLFFLFYSIAVLTQKPHTETWSFWLCFFQYKLVEVTGFELVGHRFMLFFIVLNSLFLCLFAIICACPYAILCFAMLPALYALREKIRENNPHHETLTSHLTVSYTATKALPTRCRKGFCSQFKIVIHNQSISFAVRSVCLMILIIGSLSAFIFRAISRLRFFINRFSSFGTDKDTSILSNS